MSTGFAVVARRVRAAAARDEPGATRKTTAVCGGLAFVLAALAFLLWTSPSLAQVGTQAIPAPEQEAPPGLTNPPSPTSPPPGYRLSADQAIRIALSSDKVREDLHGGFLPGAYLKSPRLWQVSLYDLNSGRELAQIVLDDRSGRLVEVWTGDQVFWHAARGTEGAFGRKLNAPYVWIPLMVLFIVPFIDPRRPFRLLHLDLLVLLGFSLSHIFLNRGEIGTSVPLVYPVLVYLLVRMLLFVYRRGFGNEDKPVRPLVPVTYLAIGLVLLAAGHVVANVSTHGNVYDIGYAGVVGGDRLTHGEALYGNFPADADTAPGDECCISRGDTYGPVNYYAYVPFEQLFPWHGRWDELPAAHAAALFFDFGTMLGLFLIGLTMRQGRRGRELGVMLSFAWAAYPYTWLNLTISGNDSLVAMMLVYSFLVLRFAAARGAMIALAGFTKFAPFALVPLYLFYSTRRRQRARFVAGFAAAALLALLPVLLKTGPSEFWDRTMGAQLGRDTPFSIWGQEPSLGWLQDFGKVLVIGLALFVAFVPRRKSPLQVAALGAALLIALQIVVSYWFYMYIVWFLPFVLIALLGEEPQPEKATPPRGPRAKQAERLPFGQGQERIESGEAVPV
jgi:hypothetical protein